jgi:hypothetical protein
MFLLLLMVVMMPRRFAPIGLGGPAALTVPTRGVRGAVGVLFKAVIVPALLLALYMHKKDHFVTSLLMRTLVTSRLVHMTEIPSIITLSPLVLLLRMVVMIHRRFAPIGVGGPAALTIATRGVRGVM